MPFQKKKLLKILNSSLLNIPSPSNINYMWNMGSLLGMCMFIQILSGLFLSFHYSSDSSLSFSNLSHIMRDTNYGWLIRSTHANGASMLFMLIFIHMGRGIYFSSFHFLFTWLSGVMILLLLMATAFLGYVLPWGQMSFWGATVITNLLSAIPYMGKNITLWIWGGFSIGNSTLTRFFSLHFILPFLILMFIFIHIMFLHETGSNNPLGTPLNLDKIPFHPYFSIKDILGFMIFILFFSFILFLYPYFLCDPENFIQANPLSTPPHIQPEWYFLFAYAILRSIPNKLGGVVSLLFSILIFTSLPLSINNKFNFHSYYIINKFMFWIFINIFFLLTFMGMCPVEPPFIFLSQILTFMYFSFFIFKPFLQKLF